MPRRKTFRKRRQKRVQKGGAARIIEGINNNSELPAFNDTPIKYYGMVLKTRKNKNSLASGGVDSDITYESFIVNEDQKRAICANATDKEKIMVAGAEGDSFKQFYEDSANDKEELITFFEFADNGDKKLDDLKIDKVDDINWTTFVGCP